MYLTCTLTHASNLMTARLHLETLSRESLSTHINLVKSQAHVLNSGHWWFKSKFTALPSFLKRKKKTCNKINDHWCLHFCWCISASKITSTYSEVRDTFLINSISSGLPSRLGFCAQLSTQFVKCLDCAPLILSHTTAAAEDTQISRARERRTMRCVTTISRCSSSSSELGCAQLVVQDQVRPPELLWNKSTFQKHLNTHTTLPALLFPGTLKKGGVPKTSVHLGICFVISYYTVFYPISVYPP